MSATKNDKFEMRSDEGRLEFIRGEERTIWNIYLYTQEQKYPLGEFYIAHKPRFVIHYEVTIDTMQTLLRGVDRMLH